MVATSQPQPSRAQRRHDAALALFDAACAANYLSRNVQPMLGLALVFFDAAQQTGAEYAEEVAHDMVLAAPIDGLTSDEQCVLASVLVLQRAKLRRQREPAFLRLKKGQRTTALQLAALLYLADGLSHSASASVHVHSDDSGVVALWNAGRSSKRNATLEERVERWRNMLGPLTVQPATASQVRVAAQATPHLQAEAVMVTADLNGRDVAQLHGDEQLSEGARRMLRNQFKKMLARTKAVLTDDDPEDVHQMRVATRRLRASLQIVEHVFEPSVTQHFRKGLRRIAHKLGTVRDHDVLLEHVQAYRASLSEDEQALLEPLLAAIEERRAHNRAQLRAELGSRSYAKLIHQFAVFLTTPGAAVVKLFETGAPPQVRDRAGSLIWRTYEDWRAFDAVLPGAPDATYHHARIAGKRLRYTIEFFSEALGPQSSALLAPLMTLQDTLGALQDGVAAREMIRALKVTDEPGTQMYLVNVAAEHTKTHDAVAAEWNNVANAEYRQRLLELIAAL